MSKQSIEATKRTVTGKQVGALRRQGILPGVLYGHNFEPTAISMDAHTTSKVLNTVTSSSIVNIVLDGKEHAALVREKQRNYLKGTYLHVDFQVVSLTEKIRTMVGIELVGTAPAVKDFNGMVVFGAGEVEVEALPQDLPEKFVVDVSVLETIGAAIHIRDIAVSDKVTVLSDLNEMVAVITAGGEEETVEEEVTSAEPEVIERGKKEEVED